MEDTIASVVDKCVDMHLEDGEEVHASVRVRLLADSDEFVLALTGTRLLGIRLLPGGDGDREDGDGEVDGDLDASIPLEMVAGVEHEEYDAVDELVVSLSTGASVRFAVEIGREHSARSFVGCIRDQAPTQVIPVVAELDALAELETAEGAAETRALDVADSPDHDAAEDETAEPGMTGLPADDRIPAEPAALFRNVVENPEAYFLQVDVAEPAGNGESAAEATEPTGECPHCELDNSPAAVFCSGCGTEL